MRTFVKAVGALAVGALLAAACVGLFDVFNFLSQTPEAGVR